ncbi:hypothetical protein O3M35_011722 [Rhynocoris fuscipes]|uniref:Uncharacterized protein n=1 Tax=Rhynocoris fuscipes TaxID=488301 RepID=A0AAW1CWA7_9HEMI
MLKFQINQTNSVPKRTAQICFCVHHISRTVIASLKRFVYYFLMLPRLRLD